MSAPSESAATSSMVNNEAVRLRIRQKTKPKARLKGRNTPARLALRPWLEFIADGPPLIGELVSMVSCEVPVALAASLTEGVA